MSNPLVDRDHFRLDENRDLDRVVLVSLAITRRGPIEQEVCRISWDQWRRVAERTIDILTAQSGGQDEDKVFTAAQATYFGLMPGREVAVLLWALIEDTAQESQEAILLSWRELAREERWWLFRKCSMPGQGEGRGWRRALLYALSDRADLDADPPAAGRGSETNVSNPTPATGESDDETVVRESNTGYGRDTVSSNGQMELF